LNTIPLDLTLLTENAFGSRLSPNGGSKNGPQGDLSGNSCGLLKQLPLASFRNRDRYAAGAMSADGRQAQPVGHNYSLATRPFSAVAF